MNRTKSILMSATALAMSGIAAQANAQTTQGAAVVFLPVPATDTQPAECRNQNRTGSTRTFGISSDGTTVVGELIFGTCIVVWRNGVPAAQPGSQIGFGFGGSFSNDGRVVVGYSNDTIGSVGRTRYWTASTNTMQEFPVVETLTEAQFNARFPNGFPTRRGLAVALGDARRVPINQGYVNSDGTVFALNTAYEFSDPRIGSSLTEDGRIVLWRPGSGYLELPTFGTNQPMTVAGIDGSGNRVVGSVLTGSQTALFENETFAFLWDATTGLSRLPDLAASLTDPTRVRITQTTGISRDGSTIIGFSRAADSLLHPVIWRGNVITDLGFIAGRTPTPDRTDQLNRYTPLAASAGGVVIVGKVGDIGAGNGVPATDRAWRWSTATGMQDLQQVALNAGLNLNGFDLYEANGVSDDGQFISGNSYNATQNQYLGFVLQLAQVTQSRLIVTIRLPGVTQTSIVNQTFNTQVDALLNGTNVFTRTVTDPINGAGGVTALADARSALQVGSGLRRVVIGAPTLLSNTTTVLGMTNNTIDVASGTATTTATVNTFGPAVVATGNLGTCATPAANNTNPTGCSLPGTPVTVDTGILNSNVFTNTINSVTPTTTQTVNQLITARWQIAATAGNQFGTVHALGGVAAFDRGDRLIGQLLGMGGGSAGADRLARAELPVGNAHGFGEHGGGTLSMFGGYFNNRARIDADTDLPVARTTGTGDGFVLGLEQELGDDARIGLAIDHGSTTMNVRDPAYPETLRFRQTQIGLFGGWQSGHFAINGAVAYGFGEARTTLATPTTPATASRDINSWSLGAQAGYTLPLGRNASVELVTGVRHVSASLNDFAETGGPTPLLGDDDNVSRTRVYAGLEGEARFDLGGVTLTPRLHARVAHDTGDARGAADLVFASAPTAPAMTALGAHVGRTVAEIGGNLDVAVSDNVTLWAGYDGHFRDGSRNHSARGGLTVRW